jgi:hypothetical protein
MAPVSSLDGGCVRILRDVIIIAGHQPRLRAHFGVIDRLLKPPRFVGLPQ